MAAVYQCRQVVDEQGRVSYLPVADAAEPGPGRLVALAATVNAAVVTAGSQVPKSVAAVAGTALAPTLANDAGQAVAAAVSGDYATAVAHGLPAVLGVVGALVALLTPSPVLGAIADDVLDERIKQAVGGLTAEQLLALLDAKAGAEPVKTVGHLDT